MKNKAINAAPQGEGGTTQRVALLTPPLPACTAPLPPWDPRRALPARFPRAFGFREALGSGVAAALALPQLTSFAAPLPALQVTHQLLCAPTSRSQVPTHSAHSWHSRLCRAVPARSPTPARAARLGGGQRHAQVSAKRFMHPQASSWSAGQDGPAWPRVPMGIYPWAGAAQLCLPCHSEAGPARAVIAGSLSSSPAARLLSRLPSSCNAMLSLRQHGCDGGIWGNCPFIDLILYLRRPRNSL